VRPARHASASRGEAARRFPTPVQPHDESTAFKLAHNLDDTRLRHTAERSQLKRSSSGPVVDECPRQHTGLPSAPRWKSALSIRWISKLPAEPCVSRLLLER
jgi:hypothetical protein